MHDVAPFALRYRETYHEDGYTVIVGTRVAAWVRFYEHGWYVTESTRVECADGETRTSEIRYWA